MDEFGSGKGGHTSWDDDLPESLNHKLRTFGRSTDMTRYLSMHQQRDMRSQTTNTPLLQRTIRKRPSLVAERLVTTVEDENENEYEKDRGTPMFSTTLSPVLSARTGTGRNKAVRHVRSLFGLFDHQNEQSRGALASVPETFDKSVTTGTGATMTTKGNEQQQKGIGLGAPSDKGNASLSAAARMRRRSSVALRSGISRMTHEHMYDDRKEEEGVRAPVIRRRETVEELRAKAERQPSRIPLSLSRRMSMVDLNGTTSLGKSKEENERPDERKESEDSLGQMVAPRAGVRRVRPRASTSLLRC